MKYLLLALLCAALITGMSACSFTVIDDPISSTRENTKETINTPATTDKNYTSETNKTEENIKDDEKTSGKVEILYKADDIELTNLQMSSSFRTYEFDDCIIYGTTTYEDVPKAYSQFTMYDKTDGKLLARSDKIFSLSLPYFSSFENGKYLLSFDIEFNKDIIEIERKNDILTVNRITNDKEEDNKTEYPYYSTKITSQDGKYTAQIIEEDEKGHGGINVITDGKGHKRVLTDIAFGDWIADKNKKADEGDTLRHDLVSFIDNTRFIYLRIGYEWSCGFGIYDVKTNKNIIFEDMRIPTIYDGHIYAVSVSGDDYGWYDINTFFKIAPDGTKTDLDFNEIPSGRVLFQNGYWIIQFDSRSMADNYGVPEGEYKTLIRVYTDDLDKKLLEVSVPKQFDVDTLLGNGFITLYNNRIFIPAD
ncbi:MAG: hypothetical protein E7665_05130 [Ruminococcaceae bacterium]|nr:hypothetical protein [Oscillospiraceae bacterium]